MRDQRAEALAQILVRYSTRVQEGDVCVIQSTTAAEVLVQAVYEEVLRAGGHPIIQLTTTGAQAAFYEHASDAQLDWVSPMTKWAAENADVRIAIMADVNARELQRADPSKQARAQKARKPLMETSMQRAAEGKYRWALTLFPTEAYAAEAGMSLREYEDFFYAACLADDPDPVTAWERQSDDVKRLAEWINGRSEVHIKAPGTDLTLGVEGRTWIPCAGRAQHARRRVLHRPGRGLGERRGGVLVPGRLRRPRGGGRALPLRGRQGRGRLRRHAARTS